LNTDNKIDISIQRRRYYIDKSRMVNCPECGSGLIEEGCTILLNAKSDSDEGKFMTSLSGSHFCKKCPVVGFDVNTVQQAASIGIRGSKNLEFYIEGIIDLDAIPEDKKHLEIGCDENPVPIVPFLPDFNSQTVIANVKPGRNAPCSCGSGVKYKRCCGKHGKE